MSTQPVQPPGKSGATSPSSKRLLVLVVEVKGVRVTTEDAKKAYGGRHAS